MIRKLTLPAALLLVLVCVVPPARAQQPSMEDLIKQIEALTKSIQAMQKDLQDIKTMLQSRMAPPPPPQNVLLDLTGQPSRGENTAKLTLIEFSDYQ